MASGTSNPIAVATGALQYRRDTAQFSPVNGIELEVGDSPKSVGAPIASGAQIGYLGMNGFRNRHGEFAFERINEPDWGPDDCIARYTGAPINRPAHIPDYHIIGLARAVDQLIKPVYQGRLLASYTTPNPGS